ncbi:MAG: phosphatase domain-containing protein [Chloroflexota bacterium]
MAGWLERGLFKIEDLYDEMRLGARSILGTSRLPVIRPYIGHANDHTLYLRGRVLLSDRIQAPTEDDSTWRNFRNTYYRFNSSEIPRAKVTATLQGHMQEAVCDEEGFFRFELTPQAGVPTDSFWCEVQLAVADTPIRGLSTEQTETSGLAIVPSAEAHFGVISDLDDTIMRTEVLNTFKMLRNTFLENAYTRFAFAGASTFYRALQAGTAGPWNPIFYVSSSPWNLYGAIQDFFKIKNIPAGPLYLRDLGISRRTFRGNGHMGHKLSFIEQIFDRHPYLPFILIGDSGQKDANIYHEVARRYPDRVLAIYIRDVEVLSRATYVEEIALQVKQETGVDMLLFQNTAGAAEHAADRGYIAPEALQAVRERVNA